MLFLFPFFFLVLFSSLCLSLLLFVVVVVEEEVRLLHIEDATIVGEEGCTFHPSIHTRRNRSEGIGDLRPTAPEREGQSDKDRARGQEDEEESAK